MKEDIYTNIILDGFKVENVKYIIYGTGKIADIYYDEIVREISDEGVVCFINEKMSLNEYKGKKVVKCREIPNEYINDKNIKFITATISKILMFNRNLEMLGIDKTKIINPTHVFSCDSFEADDEKISKVIVYPCIEKQEKLKELIDEFMNTTFFNPDNEIEIDFLSKVYYELQLPQGYRVVNDEKIEIKEEDLVWVWKAENVQDDFLRDKKRVVCCDDNFLYHSVERMHMILNNKINHRKYDKLYEENYMKLAEQIKEYKYSVVCGMGPSLKNMDEKTEEMVKKGCIIVCNNFYNVDSSICPHIYVLQDNDFLSEREKERMDAIADYIIEKDSYLFVDDRWTSTLLSRYPKIINNIIGLHVSEQICFPSKEQLMYYPMDNVVPCMCIPIASALKDIIYIIGCDGSDAKGGWEHADGRYLDNDIFKNRRFLMVNSIETNYEYTKYVDQLLDNVMLYGENMGKQYISLAKSSYASLKNRMIRE